MEEVTSQPNTLNVPIVRPWVSWISALWRHCKRFQDETDQDEQVVGQECLSDSDPERALTNTAPMVLLSHSSDLAAAEISHEHIRDQMTDSVKNCNYLTTKRGGTTRLRAAHSDVPISILPHTAIKHDCDHSATNVAGHTDTPQIQLDVRSAEQGARFLPAGHDTANSKASQDTKPIVNWRFCTMNMTVFSTQHPAIFDLGCHVCGLQEKRLRTVGKSCLDRHWKPCALPGKRGQEASRLLLDRVWSCREHRCSWHWGSNGACHRTSLYGFSGAGDKAEGMRQNEQLKKDAFQFLAGLGVVSIMILADLNITTCL